jgi:hypothetical protein
MKTASLRKPTRQIHTRTSSFRSFCFRLHTSQHCGTASWPRRITIATHDFKRRRFLECHLPALGLGSSGQVRVDIIGINPPEEVTPCTILNAGEENAGIGLWKDDLYGVGSELMGMRRSRYYGSTWVCFQRQMTMSRRGVCLRGYSCGMGMGGMSYSRRGRTYLGIDRLNMLIQWGFYTMELFYFGYPDDIIHNSHQHKITSPDPSQITTPNAAVKNKMDRISLPVDS